MGYTETEYMHDYIHTCMLSSIKNSVNVLVQSFMETFLVILSSRFLNVFRAPLVPRFCIVCSTFFYSCLDVLQGFHSLSTISAPRALPPPSLPSLVAAGLS